MINKVFLCLLFSFLPDSSGRPHLLCMFWNVENFIADRGHINDKCRGVAKTIFLAGDEFGDIPDLIGLAEVGDRNVLLRLITGTSLRRTDYAIVHYDSPDRRGIDCALLYRRTRFRMLFSSPCHICDSTGQILPTRDILLAVLYDLRESTTIAVLVNHHPSKLGRGSESRRTLAMGRLNGLRDSLLATGIRHIVAVGDFNDEVRSAPGLERAWPKGMGTYKYQGKWSKIDGCPVLEGFRGREHIFAPAHLSTRDAGFAGLKPRRSWSGPRYTGGLSDHYPIVLELLYL